MAFELETERGIVRVPTGTWAVQAHSSVEFRIKHMMVATVRGRFASSRHDRGRTGLSRLEGVGDDQDGVDRHERAQT
jgi:hypothetical protein